MPIIGDQSKPTNGTEWFGLNSTNHFAELLTMPADGNVTAVGFWAAGKDAACDAVACVWAADGTLIAASAAFSMAGRALGGGAGYGGDDYFVNVDPINMASGTQFYAGFARDPAGQAMLATGGAGTHKHLLSATWPNNLYGASDHGVQMGAYAQYEAADPPPPPPPPPPSGASVKARRGGAWVSAPVWVRRNGAWVRATSVRMRRNGAWVNVP